jgi:tetratricopeptide (TPR) repeat protein
MFMRLAFKTTFMLALNCIALSQAKSADAWSECRSPDADNRLRGCTIVIDANGYGSQSKLAIALDGRCWAYHVKTQFNLAIEDCMASIRLRPKYPYVHNNLGTAYAGLGNYRSAIVAFSKSIELKPDFYWSRMNRAQAFVAIGEMDEAIKDYEYLLDRNPTNQDIRSRLAQLRVSDVQDLVNPIVGVWADVEYGGCKKIFIHRHGRWERQDGALPGFVITSRKIEGYETDCKIIRIRQLSAKTVKLDLVCESEGEVERDARTYTALGFGRIRMESAGVSQVLERCDPP